MHKNVKVEFEIKNRTSVTYQVRNLLSTIYYEGTLNNGENSLVINDLPIDTYIVIIRNAETDKYASSFKSAVFYVEPFINASVSVAKDTITYGENATITLTSDYDGLYEVIIDDNTKLQMNVTNGSATKSVKLNAGTYNTHTRSLDYHYELKCRETGFTVNPAQINVQIIMNKTFEYLNNVAGEIISDVDGIYIIGVESHQYQVNVTNKTGRFSFKAPVPGYGYWLSISYIDKNYKVNPTGTSFDVDKGNADMKMNIPDIVVKEDLVIESDVPFAWIYMIEVFNQTYSNFVKPGDFHIPIKYNGWEAGEYEAKMTLTENPYCYGTYTTHFKVLKANTTEHHVVTAIGELDDDYNAMSESKMTEPLSSTNALNSGISTDTNVLEDNLTPEAKNNNLSNNNIGKTIPNNQNLTGVALVLVVLMALCLFVVARKRKN